MTKMTTTEEGREVLGQVCQTWIGRVGQILGEPDLETVWGRALVTADIEWRQGDFEDSIVRLVMLYEGLVQDPHYETSARDLWTRTQH